MTLKLMGVEKVIAAIKDVNSELNAKIDAEIDAQAQSIATRAKRKAPSNFSELRNSIGTEKVSNLKYTVFANAYHAPYIEFGTVKKVSVPPELTAGTNRGGSGSKRPCQSRQLCING
ncbi:HK97 gp10 family phage protein [bacterium]|nr:HK97 gp10 family phage protein [bacterium]